MNAQRPSGCGVELISKVPSSDHIDAILNKRPASLAARGADTILHAMSVYKSIRDAVTTARSVELSSLVIAVCASLVQSVEKGLKLHARLVNRHAGVLLTAAICRTDCFNINSLEAGARILQLLLETGINADCHFDGETPFSMLVACQSEILDEPDEGISDTDSDHEQIESWRARRTSPSPRPSPNRYHHGIVADYISRAKILSILLGYGADPNQIIKDFLWEGASAPPMVVVLTEQNPEILLEVLLSFETDVSLTGSHGFTPLLYAIAWDEQESVKMLLTKADPRRLNSRGRVPFPQERKTLEKPLPLKS